MQHHRFVSAARFLGTGLDVLLVALVAIAVLQTPPGGRLVAAAVLGVTFVAMYLGGRRAVQTAVSGAVGGEPTPARPRRDVLLWIGALTVLWVGLLLVTDAGVWVAFPLMVIQMLALGPHLGMLAVGGTLVVAVAAEAAQTGALTPAMVLGPTLGAAVATGVVMGFRALVREAQEHERTATELGQVREHLAEAEKARTVAGERERLAREIHDTLAQGFSAIELLLRAAEPAVGSDDERARRLVAQARSAAQDNLEEARRVVRALAPADLQGSTLVGALSRVAERVDASTPGLTVRVRTAGVARPLPVPVETAVLRMAQSALANVAQHARAGRVDVTLSFEPDEVILDVVDDGIGLDRSREPAGRGGFGLVAMRSRLAELDGTLSLESTPGEGTALAVRVPVPHSEHDAPSGPTALHPEPA